MVVRTEIPCFRLILIDCIRKVKEIFNGGKDTATQF